MILAFFKISLLFLTIMQSAAVIGTGPLSGYGLPYSSSFADLGLVTTFLAAYGLPFLAVDCLTIFWIQL